MDKLPLFEDYNHKLNEGWLDIISKLATAGLKYVRDNPVLQGIIKEIVKEIVSKYLRNVKIEGKNFKGSVDFSQIQIMMDDAGVNKVLKTKDGVKAIASYLVDKLENEENIAVIGKDEIAK